MIKLTRLDGQAFILNADLIRYVERRPDTYVTLTSGERIVVREEVDVVVERAVEYQQRKCMLPAFHRDAGTAAASGLDPMQAKVNDNHNRASA